MVEYNLYECEKLAAQVVERELAGRVRLRYSIKDVSEQKAEKARWALGVYAQTQ